MYFANMPKVFINIVLAFINVRDIGITVKLFPISEIWKQQQFKIYIG